MALEVANGERLLKTVLLDTVTSVLALGSCGASHEIERDEELADALLGILDVTRDGDDDDTHSSKVSARFDEDLGDIPQGTGGDRPVPCVTINTEVAR